MTIFAGMAASRTPGNPVAGGEYVYGHRAVPPHDRGALVIIVMDRRAARRSITPVVRSRHGARAFNLPW